MNDIGCVIYTETKSGIKAEWIFSENKNINKGFGIGTRITKLNTLNRFEGTFEIEYTDINGVKSPKLELVISFQAGYYYLTWINNNTTTDIGIGLLNDGKLSVGYRQWRKSLK